MKGKNKKITITIIFIIISLIMIMVPITKEKNIIIKSNEETIKNEAKNVLENTESQSIQSSEKEYSIEWQKSVGSDYITEFKSAVKTSDGGIIAVGSTDANTSIEGYEQRDKKGYGNQDGIIVKFSYDGEVEWSKLIGGKGNDELFKIESKPSELSESNEELYVVGGYVDSSSVKYDDEDLSLVDYGQEDGFVMMIDKEGKKQWAKTIGKSENNRINAVAITESGEVAVTGSYYDNGVKKGFVCTFNNAGECVWHKDLTGTSSSGGADVWGKAITTTSEGFAVGVNFNGELTIKGESVEAEKKIANTGRVDAVIIGFSSDGDYKWESHLGSDWNDEIYDITRFETDDGETEIAVVGAFSGTISEVPNLSRSGEYDGMLVKLNENNGTVKKAISIGGRDNGVIDSVVPTNNGGVLLGGWTYSSSISHSGESIITSNSGKNEGLIFELDASNNLVWSDAIQGELYDCVNDIVYMGDGSYYAVGDFNSKSITNGNENIKKKVQEDKESNDGAQSNEVEEDKVLLKNNGSYDSDAFVIKYVDNTYEPPAGKVTVHYMIKEENGEGYKEKENFKEIKNGKIGEEYTTEEKKIEHYELERTEGTTTGTYTREDVDVYYYYVLKEYEYRIEYYFDDEIDNNSTVKKMAKYGSTVTESPDIEKEGYKLVNKTSENGEIDSNENEVQLQISDDTNKNVIKFYYENTEFKTITVKKVWEMSDEEAENYKVTIQLMRIKDGEKVPLLDKEKKIFTAQIIGNRSEVIKDVPINKGGSPVEYALKEIKVEKRVSPDKDEWEEVPLTNFNIKYEIEKSE